MKNNSRFLTIVSKPVLGLSVILAIIGLGLWIFQLNRGLGITGLTQDAVWGLYIAGFFTAAGAGAGLLSLAGFSILNSKDKAGAGDRLQLFSAALACFAAAGVLIVMDIGKVSHIFSMIFSFNYASSMTQDFWALIICSLVAVWGLLKSRAGESNSIFGIICLLASLGLVIVEGLMLSRVSAHTYWGSATVAAFLVSMGVAGCAVALLLLPGNLVLQARRYLMAGLIASALLTVVEVLTLAASTGTAPSSELSTLLSGPAGLPFWVYVLAGLVIPLVLLGRSEAAAAGAAGKLAAVLALAGILAEKLSILIVGLQHPLVAIPGRTPYHISAVELLAVIGMAGLGVVVYVLLTGLLGSAPVRQTEKTHLAQ